MSEVHKKFHYLRTGYSQGYFAGCGRSVTDADGSTSEDEVMAHKNACKTCKTYIKRMRQWRAKVLRRKEARRR